MNILIIKQTSLGDVLHSTGHVREIKRAFPEAKITLLTSTMAMDLYRHNPHLERIVRVDRDLIKKGWRDQPGNVWQHVQSVIAEINDREYALALDLQGLAKSVLFLYAAKAERKVVKGRWWGLDGFRDKSLHAIEEMSRVLATAGVPVRDSSMEIFTAKTEQKAAATLLAEINPEQKPLLVLSPFTRWPSKNWPLASYLALGQRHQDDFCVAIAGAPGDKSTVDQALQQCPETRMHNVAGRLTLLAFAEFLRLAKATVTGDSFPMHLACAVGVPLVAFFGPTDASKTGPVAENAMVLRPDDCQQCDQPRCEKACLSTIDVSRAERALTKLRKAN